MMFYFAPNQDLFVAVFACDHSYFYYRDFCSWKIVLKIISHQTYIYNSIEKFSSLGQIHPDFLLLISVQLHQQSTYSMLTFVHHSLKIETWTNLWERGV